MKNDIKEKQGSGAGRYERSSVVNGKYSYKKYDKAIWLDNEQHSWMIGDLKDLGSTTGFLYARDDFGGVNDENNVWNYWNGDEWKTSGTNDVTVECTPGTFKFFKKLL